MDEGLVDGSGPIPFETNRVAKGVLDASFHIHTELGPGLLESVYQRVLVYELKKRGFFVQEKLALPVIYDEVCFDNALQLDILVNRCLIVEMKAVEGLLPVHEAQLMTYLKLSGHRLGLLINFNVVHLKQGIRRIAM